MQLGFLARPRLCSVGMYLSTFLGLVMAVLVLEVDLALRPLATRLQKFNEYRNRATPLAGFALKQQSLVLVFLG